METEGTLSMAGAHSDAREIIETAQEAAEPKALLLDRDYAVLVPEGAKLETFSTVTEAPERSRGAYTVNTVASFIELVERLKRDESTVWVSHRQSWVVAVLNDNAVLAGKGDVPGWGDHRVTLPLVPTSEWNHWRGSSGQLMEQEAFAEHIEDGVKEIVEPDAATMLEIAQSIHATTKTEFRSAKRLADGSVHMKYDEQVEGSAGRKGDLSIPQEFTLAIAPFLDEEPYRVTARLRYRINGGQLRIGYRLDRPDDIVLDAVKRIADNLGEKFSNVYLGEPAGARI